jgi:beta-N-acetylhexosaminidase
MRELNREDLAPYRELRNELPMIMVSHAAYPDTPGGKLPASVSPYWITNVLRRRIGYRGIIFSDDLEMGGILKFMPIEEVVIAAVRAGMDLMEICHSPELILRAHESLIAEAERSATFRDVLVTCARQTSLKRKKLLADKISAALSARHFEALRAPILRFGETVSKAQPAAEDALREP